MHDQASAAQRGAYRFQSRNAERVVSCWCFNPGLAMLELAAQGVRNIILTSGALSPLASAAAELKMYVDNDDSFLSPRRTLRRLF